MRLAHLHLPHTTPFSRVSHIQQALTTRLLTHKKLTSPGSISSQEPSNPTATLAKTPPPPRTQPSSPSPQTPSTPPAVATSHLQTQARPPHQAPFSPYPQPSNQSAPSLPRTVTNPQRQSTTQLSAADRQPTTGPARWSRTRSWISRDWV